MKNRESKTPGLFSRDIYLIVLAHNNIFCIEQFLPFLITHVIFTVQRLLEETQAKSSDG